MNGSLGVPIGALSGKQVDGKSKSKGQGAASKVASKLSPKSNPSGEISTSKLKVGILTKYSNQFQLKTKLI